MLAMCLQRIGPLHPGAEPLVPCDLPAPRPRPHEVVVRVAACGVCRTDLDEVEGRLVPPQLPRVLGHQAVGRVECVGDAVVRWRPGDRVGVGWIHSSCGGSRENLAPEFVATGYDVDGGFAELLAVPEDYAFAIPAGYHDAEAAPLLCAGAVGCRALAACGLRDGEPLGFTGFGASSHLVLQMARYLYPRSAMFVFARGAAERELARSLGAAWTGSIGEQAPERLAAIVDTTPAWRPVVEALAMLRPGGRLVINAIRKEDADREELLRLSYHEHLWREKELRTVTNVTAADIRCCLEIAARVPLRPTVTTYGLRDANRALQDLRAGGGAGAKVLLVAAAGAGLAGASP